MDNRIGSDYVFFIHSNIQILCSAQMVLFIITEFTHTEGHDMYIPGTENNKTNTHVPTPQFVK